jgi:hypothetical protein
VAMLPVPIPLWPLAVPLWLPMLPAFPPIVAPLGALLLGIVVLPPLPIDPAAGGFVGVWLEVPVWDCAGTQNKAAPVARAATVTNRNIIAHLIRSRPCEPERRRAAAAGD